MTVNAVSRFVELVSFAAKRVLLIGHRLHMIWIDAASDATQMINLSIFGNRTNQQFIAESMGTSDCAFPADAAITAGILVSNPEPTSRREVWTNFRLQTIRQIANIPVSHNRPHDVRNDVMGSIFLEREG
jgi:hypothetical protein